MGADSKPGVTYAAARAVLRPAIRGAARRDWQGQNHLPRQGGCVVVSNHLSHADPLPLADFLDAAGRYPRFLGKAELFDIPVMGRLLRNVGQIPVQRESEHAGAALSAAVEAVRAGECVVIYPEGTLTRDPDLWPMIGKTGAARIWWQTRCPVIPVVQWGPHELLPPYGRLPRVWRRPVMRVAAGARLTLSDADPPQYPHLTAEIMASLSKLLASIREVSAPTSVFDPRASDLPRTGNPRKNPRDGNSAVRDGAVGSHEEGTA
ncbi:MAG: lysophospholipid acyltransferase family protein [Actinomycetes bacterium]